MQGTSYENMTIIVQNYVESLISKYPYWNRTLGADHFFVTCHDVGVRATEGLPLLVKNSIRAVCSPSYDVGFIPHKDVALPQVLQPFALPAGGNDVENRWSLFRFTFFFASSIYLDYYTKIGSNYVLWIKLFLFILLSSCYFKFRVNLVVVLYLNLLTVHKSLVSKMIYSCTSISKFVWAGLTLRTLWVLIFSLE